MIKSRRSMLGHAGPCRLFFPLALAACNLDEPAEADQITLAQIAAPDAEAMAPEAADPAPAPPPASVPSELIPPEPDGFTRDDLLEWIMRIPNCGNGSPRPPTLPELALSRPSDVAAAAARFVVASPGSGAMRVTDAIHLLGRLDVPEAVTYLDTIFTHTEAIVESLLGDPRLLDDPQVRATADNQLITLRLAVVQALDEIESAEADSILARALEDEAPLVRLGAARLAANRPELKAVLEDRADREPIDELREQMLAFLEDP